ncbi:hypothetical protein VPHD479_0065 [Vibrio phage D479]
MKTFEQFSESKITERNGAASMAAYDWAVDKLENSDMDIDKMKKEFVKKFGHHYMNDFNQAIDDVAGY